MLLRTFRRLALRSPFETRRSDRLLVPVPPIRDDADGSDYRPGRGDVAVKAAVGVGVLMLFVWFASVAVYLYFNPECR